MNHWGLKALHIADIVLVPFVYPAAWLLKNIRKAGVQNFPFCKRALMRVGVFPIRHHYYEPQFDYRNLREDFSQDRHLPGVDFNVPGQLKMLELFTFAQELSDLPLTRPRNPQEFYLGNKMFGSGDAEYWYQIIRALKPERIIEVGSGYSTLIAVRAIRKNQEESPDYRCEHVCIEPYEMPWLEKIGVSVIRKRVEDVAPSFFSQLQENDILFIDSSHMIRPKGDVLYLYLEILPSLNRGVIVHIHDIFTPRDYLKPWLVDEVKFWNEQYLLEAFLSHNRAWAIIGALNFLHHHHYERLKAVAPFLSPEREPGSFYMQKIA